MISLSTSDVMEDYRIYGAFRLGSNFKENEWLVNFQNMKRRLDWGVTFYRNVTQANANDPVNNISYPAKLSTHLFQTNLSYPFDRARSLRFYTGIRSDNLSVTNVDFISAQYDNEISYFNTNRLEFVYDNAISVSTNLMQGLRYKAYMD